MPYEHDAPVAAAEPPAPRALWRPPQWTREFLIGATVGVVLFLLGYAAGLGRSTGSRVALLFVTQVIGRAVAWVLARRRT